MRTVGSDFEHELVINRSRFLCALSRVPDEDSARGFVAARRKTHWNATHNCTAYRVGVDGTIQRSSDDGEPSGTAGVPMLEVLRQRDLTNVVAVVTRYFGGVKLGAGGLVRAYGRAVAEAVDLAGVVRLRSLPVVTVTVEYEFGGAVEAAIRREGRLLNARYGDVMEFDVAVEEVAAARAWLAELTAGSALTEVTGSTVVESIE